MMNERLKEAMEKVLTTEITDKNGDPLPAVEAVARVIVKETLSGNMDAAAILVKLLESRDVR